jgi:predicted permease
MSWRRLLKRAWWDRERAKEIEAHIEILTAENIARGMTPEEAIIAARRKFGNPSLVREEIYSMNSIRWFENLVKDIRYAARLLRRSPGFTAAAVLSLALGAGANTAIFQLIDAMRMRSLPVERPGDLAEIRIAGGNHGMGLNQGAYGQLTRPQFEEIRRRQHAFTGLFAWQADEAMVGEGSDRRPVKAMWASGEFFSVLGVTPAAGRLLQAEDESTCPATRAVVSYAYWQGALGGRELNGVSLKVDGELTEVTGVTPPRFFGLAVGDQFDIALPNCQPKDPLRRDIFDVTVIGRLRPGWTLEQASDELAALSGGVMDATTPSGYNSTWINTYRHYRLAAYPAANGVSWLRETFDTSLWLLLGITGLVLLIACANLANLMLARASMRSREMALRLAIGASRGRLLMQSLTESAILALAGAVLGVGLAQVLSRLLVTALSTTDNKVMLPLETDWRVLLFAITVAGLACLVFGAVPAFRATQTEPESALRSGGRGMTGGRQRFSLQRFMVVTQMSVSLVLVVSALLFVRSFRNLVTFDPGMRESGVEMMFVGFQPSHVAHDRYEPFKRELLEEVRSTPGILNAATTTNPPLSGGSWTLGIHIGASDGSSKFTWVSPAYFATMAIPIVSGRGFNDRDTASSPHVVVVNRTFLRKFTGAERPIGKTLVTVGEPNYPSTMYEIVGIIPDTKYNSLRDDIPPIAFAPATQFPSEAQGPWTAMMVRTNLTPAIAESTLRRRIAEKHPEIIVGCASFEQRIRDGLTQERLMALLAGFFGLLAAGLAMIGVYGLISYFVACRQNEIGIRMALGAARASVLGLIMGEAAGLLAAGMVVGTGLALLAARGAEHLLFGLKPYDPVTIALACAVLTVIATLASFLPARRAARMEPMAALRHE